ncbi:hypothetical protein VFPPC_09764 [Pochonia chlamydosporia 170]|uniref:Uncharacterized protein n=1 Tax=Pochonia chlamydosporia 170 TaxID=1380566 RepID=A0A179FDD1_METCM|nr:hypothetical protein VFPPC_09764 [Pochonia chlamydosporia 170]OAQ63575.1 hypothetical protein VFPPC_09764 [Pochonia chlamydosporia 170]
MFTKNRLSAVSGQVSFIGVNWASQTCPPPQNGTLQSFPSFSVIPLSPPTRLDHVEAILNSTSCRICTQLSAGHKCCVVPGPEIKNDRSTKVVENP